MFLTITKNKYFFCCIKSIGLIITSLLLLTVLTACKNDAQPSTNSDTPIEGDSTQNPDGSPAGSQDAVVTQISFADPSEPELVLAGVPGPERSELVITATGANGNPVPNASITFAIFSGAGSGASLIGEDINGEVQLTTNSDGNATVSVQSGTAPAVVRVRAVDNDTGISEISGNISISTGIPVQSRLSLSLSTFSPEGACCTDGITVTATIRATDSLGNAVPDGTVFQFLASESGLLGDNSCSTTNGQCSIDWESSGPRPTDGTINLVAYTNGSEDFDDANNDGLFNLADGDTHNPAYDVEEPYQDYDDSGDFSVGDEFIDLNPSDGAWSPAQNNGWTENTIVWKDVTFVVSVANSTPVVFDCELHTVGIQAPTGTNCGTVTMNTDLWASVSDINGNSLEEGATIEWELDPDDSNNSDWELDGINGLTYTVTNTEIFANESTQVEFDPGTPPVSGTGTIDLIVGSPGRPKVVVGTWSINVP